MSAVADSVRGGRVDVSRDVPTALRHGSRIMPLGRTLVRKLRLALGKDAAAPCIRDEEKLSEMRLRHAVAQAVGKTYKEELVFEGNEKVRQMTARLKIRERKRS